MKYLFIILMKVYKRVLSKFKQIVWKVLYQSNFKCGKGTYFYPGCHMTIDGIGKVIIGNNCFFNHDCSITSLKEITIGNDCIFGENVRIYDHNHQYKKCDMPFRKQGYEMAQVKIGNNCWIGSGAIILSGVTIGKNVVIAAGSIVTKNVSDNSMLVQKRISNVYRLKVEG